MKTLATRVVSPLALCGLLLVGTAHPVRSAERELGSHEHGASTLDIVLDGDRIFVTFETPWASLVGFEHMPVAPEDVALIDAATARLGNGDELFAFPDPAGCRATEATIRSTMAVDGDRDADHDGHHDGDHDTDRDEGRREPDDEPAREARADDSRVPSSAHSEVFVTWTFACGEPSEAESIRVRPGEIWPGIERVDVQLAGPAGQHAQRLERAGGTAAGWRVDLTPVLSR